MLIPGHRIAAMAPNLTSSQGHKQGIKREGFLSFSAPGSAFVNWERVMLMS